MAERSIHFIVVHCAATRPSMDVRASDIDRWHKARGWGGIGYHYLIVRSGLMELGRPESEIGAHAYGYNRHSIGICMAGGIAEDGKAAENNFRPQQFNALITLLRELRVRYPGARICGHRDLSPDKDGDGIVEKWEWVKECPSFDVSVWCRNNGINPDAWTS